MALLNTLLIVARIIFILCGLLFAAGIVLMLIGMFLDFRKGALQNKLSEKEYIKSRLKAKKLKKTGGLTCLILIILLGVSAFTINRVMNTNYVSQKAEKVVEVVKNDSLKAKINTYVQELIDSGDINEKQIQTYITSIESDPSLTLTLRDGTVIGQSDSGTDTDGNADADGNGKNNGSNSQNANNSGDGDSSAGAAGSGPSDNTDGGNSTSGSDASGASDDGDLTSRVLSAMSPEDLQIAYSLMGKVDAGYAMSLADSDPAAAKAYIKENLSSDEIAQGLNLYGKYAYLLN